MTQNDRLVNYFKSGRTVTAREASTLFGIKSLTRKVEDLRKTGLPIYNNDGVYKLGIPRALIAKAYTAGRLNLG